MSNLTTVIYTSANLAYLDRAALLLETVRKTHPEWAVVLVLVDEYPAHPQLRRALARFDRVLVPQDLNIVDHRNWIFGYDVIEACTAVKGPALVLLLESGVDQVIYLDPDIAIFNPLVPVIERLSEAPITVTPHQLTPARDDRSIQDNEIGSLLTGVFNLGFLGVRNCKEGLAFARWWSSRLLTYCLDDCTRGLFTDQRWVDLAPVFFPGTAILRDPGLNVASWNIAEREITIDGVGNYLVNGEPLRFFHFTKALGIGPTMTLRYGGHNVHVAELWRWYLESLGRIRSQLPSAHEWAWQNYDNGVSIATQHRRAYRAREDLRRTFPDPFRAEMYDWMQQNVDT